MMKDDGLEHLRKSSHDNFDLQKMEYLKSMGFHVQPHSYFTGSNS